MPILNRVAAMHADITAWRRELHGRPELGFDVVRTAAFVHDKLQSFGCDEVVGGIGRTGVVGVIRGRNTQSGHVLGLRADMDALPIEEASGVPYASQVRGKMHACGHDGHTAMLLGAAQHLAETRNFDGTAVVIFQPAEEGGGGGREMVRDGLMERFGIQKVFGMHNWPGLPVGQFAIRTGPIMAAADRIEIDIAGKGAHAAQPHEAVDPVLIGAQIVLATQSIVARNVDPLAAAVVSLTQFAAGDAGNIIAETASLRGTARSLDPHVQDRIEARLREIVEGSARLYGGSARLAYRRDYPVTRNHPEEAILAADAAADVAGRDRVEREVAPTMTAEDFSFMLDVRPGAYILLGNGPSAGLHNPAYDFNDAAIPLGTSYWVRLVESAMPA